MTCPFCAGPMVLLQILGALLHLKCERCGWQLRAEMDAMDGGGS